MFVIFKGVPIKCIFNPIYKKKIDLTITSFYFYVTEVKINDTINTTGIVQVKLK